LPGHGFRKFQYIFEFFDRGKTDQFLLSHP
jgi:hypothetical protein